MLDEEDDLMPPPQQERPLWVGMPFEFTREIAKFVIESASQWDRQVVAKLLLDKILKAPKSPEVVVAFLSVVCDKLKIPKAVQDELFESLKIGIEPWVKELLASKSAKKAAMDLFREVVNGYLMTAVPKMMEEMGLEETSLREAVADYQKQFAAHYIQNNPAYRQRLDTLAAKVVGEDFPAIEAVVRKAAREKAAELAASKMEAIARHDERFNDALTEPIGMNGT